MVGTCHLGICGRCTPNSSKRSVCYFLIVHFLCFYQILLFLHSLTFLSRTVSASLLHPHTPTHSLFHTDTDAHTQAPFLVLRNQLTKTYTRRHEHTPSNSITYRQLRRKRVFSQTKSENVRGSQDSY